jgi:hypothetical protein
MRALDLGGSGSGSACIGKLGDGVSEGMEEVLAQPAPPLTFSTVLRSCPRIRSQCVDLYYLRDIVLPI